jgi:hypothetical protein
VIAPRRNLVSDGSAKMYVVSRRFAVPAVVVSTPLLFGTVPAALPGLVIVALLLGEGMAVLTSREACKRFTLGVASLDIDEVASVYGAVSTSDLTGVRERMFGSCEDVSLRALSTDYSSVLGVCARHVVRVDSGCSGAKRLDDMTTEVQVRLTSAGWRVEGFSPLTKSR